MEVTLESIFGELLEEYPMTEEVLKDYLGAAYCLVCPGKMFDTIGNGAALHGLSDAMAEDMVEDLQEVVDAYERGETPVYEPHVIDKGDAHGEVDFGAGHSADDGHDHGGDSHAGHTHSEDDGHGHAASDNAGAAAVVNADTQDYKEIDVSAVNIDHMFQSAMMESLAMEATGDDHEDDDEIEDQEE